MVKKVKAAFSFAHLIGLGAARAESDPGDDETQDEERKQRDGESDEDYAKRMEELDKKNAKGGQDDPDAEDDPEDPLAEDDTSGEDDKQKAARAKERARCAAIFGSKAAAGRPDVAAHLAFNTAMSAREAVGMLDAIGAGAQAGAATGRQSLSSRMAKVPEQKIGSGAAGTASPAQAAAASILDAGKKRRGEA
jgi:hypothetical protein